MKHPNYDRAFHETPEYIRSAIELGIIKGKKAAKKRVRIARALSIAAAMVIVLGAGVFGASRLGGHPDNRAPGRPLSGPAATGDPASGTPTPGADLIATATPTATPTAMATPTPPATPEPTYEPTVTPVETAEPWETRTVYAVYGTSKYYHKEPTCGTQNNRHELSVLEALSEGLESCPNCLLMNHELVAVPVDAASAAENGRRRIHYIAEGRYFHIDSECSGMVGAESHSVTDAFSSGRTPCPVCMEGWDFALIEFDLFQDVELDPTAAPTMYISVTNGSEQIAITTAAQEEEEEIDFSQLFPGIDLNSYENVYVGEFDFHFHIDPECSTLRNGRAMSVYQAIMSGYGLCPDCSPDTWTEEMVMASAETEAASSNEVLYYYTGGGTYFHLTPDCSGMMNAAPHSLDAAISVGKRHCPVCIGDRTELYWLPVPEKDDDTVYLCGDNIYYHINPECFSRNHVTAVGWTLDSAREQNYAPCPACLPSLNLDFVSPECYIADGDIHYHSNQQCFGLAEGAKTENTTEIQAQAAGKTRCALCISYDFDSARESAFRTAFDMKLTDAYPGYTFEREEVYANGNAVWYVSNGDQIHRAITFLYDEPGGNISKILISSDEWAESAFDETFLKKLSDPFQMVLKDVNHDTVFQFRVEYNLDGSISAIGLGLNEGNAFSYPLWVISADGTAEFSGEDWETF